MTTFLEKMKAQAKSEIKTIVLPEGEDPRTIEAAKQIVSEGLANIVILGDDDVERVPGATHINPKTTQKHDTYAAQLFELRARKGMTESYAKELMNDTTYFGTMMVKAGDADGLVSGACHSTANTLRPALQILKTAPGTKLVSSFMVMCIPNCEYGTEGNFVFADVGLNEYPDADALSEIVLSSAKSFEQLLQATPKIALLSYSTHGSAASEHVDKVQEAYKLVCKKDSCLACDGELQLDAAIDATVAKIKAPTSEVAGSANVLVFPNLDAGNIGYKLVQRLGKAEAYGPILQGIARPVNDLSRGCSASDIVAVVAITAVQAQLNN